MATKYNVVFWIGYWKRKTHKVKSKELFFIWYECEALWIHSTMKQENLVKMIKCNF